MENLLSSPEMLEKMRLHTAARHDAQTAARDKILTETQQLPCLVCGSPVAKDPDFAEGKFDQTIVYDGVVGTIAGGFGSRHDNSILLIALCDGCLATALTQGRALDLGGYM